MLDLHRVGGPGGPPTFLYPPRAILLLRRRRPRLLEPATASGPLFALCKLYK